ncbi:hypothetical protein [Neorhizobium sp. JUb45]|uniref:hypothetical protein n=1 Tax=unclassified Neorhizobium TaxID=2629175 RepID=UPI0010449D4D|nr:hypothetical protein [Neorhizobium sp. JUb45]TCR06742.1 hypothetical protein EDF70_101703 [Neorhizobium sp. JUb45]
MAIHDRIKRYRVSGGAADLVRVEVLVPSHKRQDILDNAATLRAGHRQKKQRLQELMDRALQLYSLRILDNIDLDRLPDIHDRSRVIANALMERGDARAFAIGRRLLAEMES